MAQLTALSFELPLNTDFKGEKPPADQKLPVEGSSFSTYVKEQIQNNSDAQQTDKAGNSSGKKLSSEQENANIDRSSQVSDENKKIEAKSDSEKLDDKNKAIEESLDVEGEQTAALVKGLNEDESEGSNKGEKNNILNKSDELALVDNSDKEAFAESARFLSMLELANNTLKNNTLKEEAMSVQTDNLATKKAAQEVIVLNENKASESLAKEKAINSLEVNAKLSAEINNAKVDLLNNAKNIDLTSLTEKQKIALALKETGAVQSKQVTDKVTEKITEQVVQQTPLSDKNSQITSENSTKITNNLANERNLFAGKVANEAQQTKAVADNQNPKELALPTSLLEEYILKTSGLQKETNQDGQKLKGEVLTGLTPKQQMSLAQTFAANNEGALLNEQNSEAQKLQGIVQSTAIDAANKTQTFDGATLTKLAISVEQQKAAEAQSANEQSQQDQQKASDEFIALTNVEGEKAAQVNKSDFGNQFSLAQSKQEGSQFVNVQGQATGVIEAQQAATVIENMTNEINTEQLKQTKINALSSNETIAIFRKDFAEAVKDKVMVMISQKLQQFDIRLDPPELGNVHVRVNLQGEQAVVNFMVQNQQAKEAFEQNLDKLKEMLSEQGVDVGESHVEQQDQQASAEEDCSTKNQGSDQGQVNELASASDVVLSTNLFDSSATSVDYYA